MNESQEQWEAIPGWEGAYEVSDHGRVRSLDRVVVRSDGSLMTVAGSVLAQQSKPRTEHRWVALSRQSKPSRRDVHQLVLEAFVGPRPDGAVARHLDDKRENNHLANLAWGTQSENGFDSVRNGTHVNANKTHCVRGHAYSDANTLIGTRASGGTCRVCATCKRDNDAKAAQRRAARRVMARAAGGQS